MKIPSPNDPIPTTLPGGSDLSAQAQGSRSKKVGVHNELIAVSVAGEKFICFGSETLELLAQPHLRRDRDIIRSPPPGHLISIGTGDGREVT